MKTRQGFVSNSSSSSFVFLGWEIERGKVDLIDFMEMLSPHEFLDADAQKKYNKSWIELTPDEKRDVCYDLQYYFRKAHSVAFLDDVEQGAPKDKTLIGILLDLDEDRISGRWEIDGLRDQLTEFGYSDEMLESLGITGSPVLHVGTMLT